MAADTAQKRLSAMNIRGISRRGSAILPDATIDQGDRQSGIRMYSGILANNPTPVANNFGGNILFIIG